MNSSSQDEGGGDYYQHLKKSGLLVMVSTLIIPTSAVAHMFIKKTLDVAIKATFSMKRSFHCRKCSKR